MSQIPRHAIAVQSPDSPPYHLSNGPPLFAVAWKLLIFRFPQLLLAISCSVESIIYGLAVRQSRMLRIRKRSSYNFNYIYSLEEPIKSFRDGIGATSLLPTRQMLTLLTFCWSRARSWSRKLWNWGSEKRSSRGLHMQITEGLLQGRGSGVWQMFRIATDSEWAPAGVSKLFCCSSWQFLAITRMGRNATSWRPSWPLFSG